MKKIIGVFTTLLIVGTLMIGFGTSFTADPGDPINMRPSSYDPGDPVN